LDALKKAGLPFIERFFGGILVKDFKPNERTIVQDKER
jgi:hypothetical protein